MGEVSVLPSTLLHRTRWGTAILYDRRQGLLVRDAAGRWRAASAEELRRGYPEAFTARLQFAAVLPAGEAARAGNQRGGGGRAA